MDDGDVQQMSLEAATDAGCTPAAPASPATDLRGSSSYQFRGDKSGNPDSKVVITDRKMLEASADVHSPYVR
jgi:hypothetical protein